MSDDDQDDSSKTEDPTPKKLEEARKKGQVPVSREVNNWVMLTAGTIVVLAMGPGMMHDLMILLRTYIGQAHDLPETPGGLQFMIIEALIDVLKILIGPILFLVAAAVIGPLVQVGPLLAPEIISMDISKISPSKGFARLFSMRSIVEFIKGILKLCVVSAVGYMIIKPYFGSMEHMVGLPIPLALDETKILTTKLLIGILVVLFIIAAADLLYQRHEHMSKMRMTKQELKDEYRQSEGDPHIKAKLRQLRQQKAQQRMMQAVPTADVVITNPTHYSVALKYDPDKDEAPLVVAKGINEVAMRIRETAREHNVIILPNPPLARLLFDQVEVDQAVPAEHYKAVAEIISYVFRMKGKLR
ncbi:MAG: flagellar biosynthesis protein FlhB [Micavibrio aeruginosavorus]|uniref:Flagellar biosynthetic protein FlhB n=1 Tax=Micavibrio aeruginosavorus TaxID=349221 RepID=A0A2W5N806_9BACT|nr:MAG: flagellar biosynthesis protein FlhB [Micavibrio aeruginosavorus]